VPNIRRRLPDSASIVLGKAILWLIFSSVANSFVSTDYCEQLKTDLSDTGIVIPEGRSPILKMPVLVSGDQGTVYIDELPAIDAINTGGGQDAAGQQQDLSMRILGNN